MRGNGIPEDEMGAITVDTYVTGIIDTVDTATVEAGVTEAIGLRFPRTFEAPVLAEAVQLFPVVVIKGYFLE